MAQAVVRVFGARIASSQSTLGNNATLAMDHSLKSSNDTYHAIMQEDGNLVVYDQHETPTWASDTNGKGANPYRLVMQDDGNLVV
ncbi:hypothetical protein I4U23_022229 [Adineta vaga]|nr:hypothetical protein I4U23_022229 [Adineta vaga]